MTVLHACHSTAMPVPYPGPQATSSSFVPGAAAMASTMTGSLIAGLRSSSPLCVSAGSSVLSVVRKTLEAVEKVVGFGGPVFAGLIFQLSFFGSSLPFSSFRRA